MFSILILKLSPRRNFHLYSYALIVSKSTELEKHLCLKFRSYPRSKIDLTVKSLDWTFIFVEVNSYFILLLISESKAYFLIHILLGKYGPILNLLWLLQCTLFRKVKYQLMCERQMPMVL